MADIQSAAAEIRRGKKEEEEEERKNKPQHENIYGLPIPYRATINKLASINTSLRSVNFLHQPVPTCSDSHDEIPADLINSHRKQTPSFRQVAPFYVVYLFHENRVNSWRVHKIMQIGAVVFNMWLSNAMAQFWVTCTHVLKFHFFK